MRRFVQERFEVSLSRSSYLNYPRLHRGQALHRLGFVLKRPKKRLLKADAAKRETFVAEYAALVDGAQQVGAQVFFVDEAHFRADADPYRGTGQALCLGAKSAVKEKVNDFFTQLAGRQPEVKQRCRTVLQTRAEGLLGKAHAYPRRPTNVDPHLGISLGEVRRNLFLRRRGQTWDWRTPLGGIG